MLCYIASYSERCDLLISDKFCCTFLHSFEKIETEKWPFLFIISLFFSIFMTFSWLHPQFLAVNGRKLLTVLIETINLTFWSKKVKIFKIYGFSPYKSTFLVITSLILRFECWNLVHILNKQCSSISDILRVGSVHKFWQKILWWQNLRTDPTKNLLKLKVLMLRICVPNFRSLA